MIDGEQKDEIFSALADERRRVALSCLAKHHEMTLPDLADELAQIEHETPIDEIPADDVKELYLDLYHRHLPYLTASNLIDYSQPRDCVSITELGTEVESTLIDSAKTLEW